MKPLVSIVRIESAGEGTFGVVAVSGRAFCVSLEPQALNNRPFVSCIPAGRYQCRKTLSPRHGWTFKLDRVPGRSDILFHRGNTLADTEGCILLGRRFGSLGGCRGILASGDVMDEFMIMMGDVSEFEVEIVDVQALEKAA